MQGRDLVRIRARRLAATAALALLGAALAAPSAQASFHLMKISEVHPDSGDQDFLELQMYADGQNFVAGTRLDVFTGSTSLGHGIPASVAAGESQRSILIANTAFSGPTPDASYADFQISPTDGAVCFLYPDDVTPIDCVSWGSFSGSLAGYTGCSGTPPACAGNSAPAISAGNSLTRSIAPNCPTLLEDADDTNNSAVDFTQTSPSPQNNSVTPTETPCTPGGGGGPGGGSDKTPPGTDIDKGPKKKSDKRKAKFSFSSDDPGAKFECKLDKTDFALCTSPFTRKVKPGKHTFQVQATDAAGNKDASPATLKFKVLKS